MLIKKFAVKLLIGLIKGLSSVKKLLFCFFSLLGKDLQTLLRWPSLILIKIYKNYLIIKRKILKPVLRNLAPLNLPIAARALIANRYIIHAAIVMIALLTTTNSIAAYGKTHGDFGKNSLLFNLVEGGEETLVEEVLANPNLDRNTSYLGLTRLYELNTADPGEKDAPNQETEYDTPPGARSSAFVGAHLTPSMSNGRTRTGIEYYIVKNGDTPSKTAAEFGISTNTLLWANKLTARSYIRPGEKLVILPVSGVSHEVKRNETILGIAKKYKADADKILEFNHLASADNLWVGQMLIVPDGEMPQRAPQKYYPQPKTALIPSRVSGGGKLLWPVNSQRITQYYSWRHPALDIGAPMGTNIYAAEAGIVESTGWIRGYGYQVLLNHGGGIKTRYTHNSKNLVRGGERVEKGQVIALIGSTGWSTGPHVHFEIYVNGYRKNPLEYL